MCTYSYIQMHVRALARQQNCLFYFVNIANVFHKKHKSVFMSPWVLYKCCYLFIVLICHVMNTTKQKKSWTFSKIIFQDINLKKGISVFALLSKLVSNISRQHC